MIDGTKLAFGIVLIAVAATVLPPATGFEEEQIWAWMIGTGVFSLFGWIAWSGFKERKKHHAEPFGQFLYALVGAISVCSFFAGMMIPSGRIAGYAAVVSVVWLLAGAVFHAIKVHRNTGRW